MKPSVLLLAVLLLSLCLLCGCGSEEIKPDPINEGETYLEGCWYLNDGDLHVGYNLFPDGGGFLFIGETVIPIRYGISGGYFYVSDNGNVESFPFQSGEDGIWIGDMLYRPMEDDPEISAAVESMRAEMDLSEESVPSSEPTGQIGALLVQLVTLAAAVGIVVILAVFFRKRRKKS